MKRTVLFCAPIVLFFIIIFPINLAKKNTLLSVHSTSKIELILKYVFHIPFIEYNIKYCDLNETYLENIKNIKNNFAASKEKLNITSLNQSKISDDLITEKKTFIDFYNEGKEAYLANSWEECIGSLEQSIALFQDYFNTHTYCSISCETEKKLGKPITQENLEHFNFYEQLIRKILCKEKCHRKHLPELRNIFIEAEHKFIFKKRIPYTYLQLCYYQEGHFKKSIDATYTAYVANPNDKMLLKNIEYYSTLKKFDPASINDLEEKDYVEFYTAGMYFYSSQNWTSAILNFEKFLSSWLLEFNKCRVFCEDDYYADVTFGFINTFANQYVAALRCKNECIPELSNIKGKFYESIFERTYDYLQYSYYKVGDIENAIRSAVTFDSLMPNTTDMMENLKFYKTLPNTTKEIFQIRQEGKQYLAIRQNEKALIEFVDTEFKKI